MSDFDIGLRYYTDIPDGYLDEFRDSFDGDEVRLSEQEFESSAYNAMEWVIPTAVAVYIAKPFIDTIIKRAADDFGDAIYPRIKRAVVNLAKKLYVRERLPLVVITSQRPKDNSDVIQFSICSETTTKRHIKFVFAKTYGEQQYEQCVEQLFSILTEHHRASDGNDSLSKQIAQLPDNPQNCIFLVYDESTETWSVRDPIQESLDRARGSGNPG